MFGGKRPNYGGYELTVDGQRVAVGNSNSATPVAQELLGTVSGLPNGKHVAVLTCTGGGVVDIDKVELEAQVGVPGCVMLDFVVLSSEI